MTSGFFYSCISLVSTNGQRYEAVEFSHRADAVHRDPVNVYQHFVNAFVFTNKSGQQDAVKKAQAFCKSECDRNNNNYWGFPKQCPGPQYGNIMEEYPFSISTRVLHRKLRKSVEWT